MAIRDRLPFNLPFSNGTVTPPQNGTGGLAPGYSESETLLGHTAPSPSPDNEPLPRAGATPFGQSGRANFWGLPQPDELNRELIGSEGLRRFNEMYRTDAHARRLILAAWSPIVAGTWTLQPYGDDDASDLDRQVAQEIWWMLTEYMSPSFTEHLLEVGPLLLRSGFCGCEQMWDTVKRNGKTLLAPRKLGIRLPISVWRWWQDDFGELTHIGQVLPNRADVVIPATELVYYRLGAEGDNWMGTSLLRHAYKHWFLKDRLERIDAIGQERKAVGVPVLYPPQGASVQQKQQLEQLLMNLHMSEVAYLMMPGPKAGSQGANAVPQEEWLLDIIKFDSSSGEGIMNSISYHQTAMSASFLTDFLELGHHQVGARATAEVQEDPFLTAINGALLPAVVPPLNKLIDRIRRANYDKAEGSPTLKLTLHDEASLSEIAAYCVPLIQSGALQVDPELEDYLRSRGGLPAADADIRAQTQAAQQAGRDAAAKLATTGQEPGAEPPPPSAQADVKPEPGTAAPGEGGNAPPTRTTATGEQETTKLDAASGPVAAGVIVHAKDTGRVLMVKRTADENDSADVFGSWEFPGGKLDGGQDGGPADKSAWKGALREWQEETGAQLPTATHLGSFDSADGQYRAFVLRVPQETDVQTGHSDKQEVAQAGWKHPDSVEGDGTLSDRAKALVPALRAVLAGTPARRDVNPKRPPAGGAGTQLDAPTAKPTVCVDFDGVIHPKADNAGALTAPPIPGAAGGLIGLSKRYDVVICTARSDLAPVRAYLTKHAMGFYAHSVTNVKPPAAAYIDDRAVPFNSWGGVEAAVEAEIARSGRTLDADAPLSGGTASAGGLQVVPGVPGQKVCTCGKGPYGDGVCQACGGTKPSKTLDAPSRERGAQQFEHLLDTGRLRQAFDNARDQMQQAVGPRALTAARKLAHQAGEGTDMTKPIPAPADLIDAFTGHYTHLYHLGASTTDLELARQRHALKRTLATGDSPAPEEIRALAASRLARGRQRGEHSARNLISAVQQRLGRDQITGLKDPVALRQGAEAAATAQLRQEALSNVAAMVNDGRASAAQASSDVIGGIYTSVLDERACDECVQTDTGDILPVADAMALGPPNPDCEGGDYCRCLILWVMSDDPAALAAAGAGELPGDGG